jgi:hypothetical protein
VASQPDPQHRLFTDLAFSAFEAGHYPASLSAASRAVASAPHCPRSLWAYACALQVAGNQAEADAAYRQLITLGMRRISASCCCHHKAHARGLIADCFLHLSLSLKDSGHVLASSDAFKEHLDLRGSGCYSIYRLEALPERTSAIQARRPVV